MKKMIIMAVSLLVLASSCTKTGPTGPQGTAGTNGTNGSNGTNGADGANGTNGVNGNANVVAGFGNIAAADWLWSASAYYDYVTLNDAQITSAIASNGAVCVFLQNGSSYLPLPYTYINSSVGNYWSFFYTTGSITFTYQRSDLVNVNPGAQYFKVVCIAASQRAAHPHTNWKNYDEVMAVVDENKATF